MWLRFTTGVLSSDPLQLQIGPPVVSSNRVEISFNSSAPTECQLDNLAFSSCKSPYQHLNLESGEHTVTIKATDDTGCVKKNSVIFYIGGKHILHGVACVIIHLIFRTRSTKDYFNFSKKEYPK